MKKLFLIAAAGLALTSQAFAQGNEVIVVFNSRVPESKAVAEHYARRRAVPANQVVGLPLPTGETMTREQFIEELQKPLRKHLEAEKLFTFGPATNRFPPEVGQDKAFRVVTSARVRYAALCYGVPVKILRDTKLAEPHTEKLPPELRRNEAAVDTQLACLLDWEGVLPWTGPIRNPYYGVTNLAALHPTNGLLMVTRLDGPSPTIARGLVDKAIEAETNGLLGRAYFDARGLTNGGYKDGDVWMRLGARVARQSGFETVLDDQPATFSAGFPMSQIAFYAGWYDQQVSGPFTRPTVEFVPGAFAYHLYSFGAQTIRNSNETWVATLLQKGAACTMGAVDEPYLSGTPDISMFIAHWLGGHRTFGEAAYVGQTVLTWQITIVGDPLYRPVTGLQKLEREKDAPSEWALLAMLVQREASGLPPTEAVRTVEFSPVTRRSAVLTEKLGDVYLAQGKMSDALDMYEGALRRGPSPMQRLRLLLSLAEKRAALGADDKALAWYETVLKEFPDYPEALRLRRQMLVLAKRLGRANLVEQFEGEIRRLSPPAAGGTKQP